jgi:hypothetical protein
MTDALLVRQVDPTGKSPARFIAPLVKPILQKYFCFSEIKIGLYDLPSRPERGAFRDRHERGAGCGGRKRCD